MHVLENTSERLVLQERYTVIYGFLLAVSVGVLLFTASAIRKGMWEIGLSAMVIPALIVLYVMQAVPFVTVLSFDKRQGALEVTYRHIIAFGERQQAIVIALAEITSVKMITSYGGDHGATSRSLRFSLRSGEPVLLPQGGMGKDFPERVRQICRFLELPEDPPTAD
jgi:hypothetical protein